MSPKTAPAPSALRLRSAPVDAAKTFAIFGTLLIHTSAMGGFAWETGSVHWLCALFWGSVLRCAVPVFFLCSGALLLDPEKEVPLRRVWTRYIPRILIALFFWAAAYEALPILLTWRRTGVVEAAALQAAAGNLLLWHHKSHLYYLHIILLVYALVPLTRFFASKADRRLMRYALGLWFTLGCVVPVLRLFPPLAAIGGIPAQYPINLTWGAVGYTLLGRVLTAEAPRHRPRTFLLLYLLGLGLTFCGTWVMSLHQGELYQGFLQGNAPGVCLEAAGLYGWCASRLSSAAPVRVTVAVSKASFCVYLTHLFFLDFLTVRGFSAGAMAPVWAVPVLAAAAFSGGFLVWLALRYIPVVNRYLI